MSGFCIEAVEDGRRREKTVEVKAPCRPSVRVLIHPRPLRTTLPEILGMTCGIRSLSRRLAVLVGAVLALPGTPAVLGAQSQATTGIIRGVVTDPSGSPVANAQVVLHETQTNFTRSEEHTSELQSLAYLVCRLLLEKK